MFKKIAAIAALAAMTAIPAAVLAQNTSAQLSVSATVVADCEFNASSYSISIGNYDFTNPNQTSGSTTGNNLLICSPGITNATPTLNVPGTVNLLNGSNTLTAALTSSYTYAGSPTGDPFVVTATILPGLNVPVGTYTGTVTLTFNV